jgi:hypothetical protein
MLPRTAPPTSLSQIACFATLTSQQLRGLALLREAREAAEAAQTDVWEFALEIAQLHTAGLSNTDLRQLLCCDLIKSGVETFRPDAARRSFRCPNSLALPAQSCFVLTEEGLRRIAVGEPAPAPPPKHPGKPLFPPTWNPTLRQLEWQGVLVKRFRLPATNQETILSVLHEEGWPPRIDDPLPQTEGIDPKSRLRDALKRLNRNQVNRLVCFRGDGTGCGILWGSWERLAPPDRPRSDP